MPTLTTIITAGLTGLLAVPLLALAATPDSGTGCVPAAAISASTSARTVPGAGGASTDTAAAATAASNPVWDGEQTGNAALIVAIGQARGVPAWGWIVAVATAMQESRLRNLPGGDRDSIGLFQQRPSQGWGTPTQLRSPAYQAGEFYDALLAVPGWQAMPLTQASDLVQRSAFPSAYARWTRPAGVLVAKLTAAHAGTSSAGAGTAACGVGCPPARAGDSAWGPGCLPGHVVLARAATWLTAWQGGPVPYSMSTDPATWFGGYRRDCSGYASMALGLPGPGLNTAGLAARSTLIAKSDLAPGDLLINPAPGGAGHVVIFQGWVDASTTSYLGYEQSGDGGTHRRVIPYPYFGAEPMNPYRCTSCAR
jgi:hypothetical protein